MRNLNHKNTHIEKILNRSFEDFEVNRKLFVHTLRSDMNRIDKEKRKNKIISSSLLVSFLSFIGLCFFLGYQGLVSYQKQNMGDNLSQVHKNKIKNSLKYVNKDLIKKYLDQNLKLNSTSNINLQTLPVIKSSKFNKDLKINKDSIKNLTPSRQSHEPSKDSVPESKINNFKTENSAPSQIIRTSNFSVTSLPIGTDVFQYSLDRFEAVGSVLDIYNKTIANIPINFILGDNQQLIFSTNTDIKGIYRISLPEKGLYQLHKRRCFL